MTARTAAQESESPTVFTPALAGVMESRMAAALLPGDTPFAPDALAEAAAFVLATAALRQPAEPAICIESVSGRAGDRFLRLAAINDDMPFLVDSIAATITARGLAIHRVVHPVMPVRRDAAGGLVDIPAGDAEGERRESMIYIETERAGARTRRALAEALAETLADVRAAVTDWPAMQAAMAADADRVPDSEGAALLRWLKDGMLTQLGHVVHGRDGEEEGALGVCRSSGEALLSAASFQRAFAWFDRGAGHAPLVIKSNRIARVHRHVPFDLFVCPVIEDGRVAALSVHAGVWTSAALAAAPQRVPRLRAQLAAIMARYGFSANGHAGKALVHALARLPHDLLAGFSEADVERVAMGMMSLIDRPRPRLLLVSAPLERHVFAFVWLPRDAVSTALRLNIRAMLEQAAQARVLDWSLEVEGSNLALIRFVLDVRSGDAAPDEAALDAQLQAMVRGWSDAIEAELAGTEDASRAAAVAARYADAFPQDYRSRYGAAEAAADIQRLRKLADGGSRDARLRPADSPEAGRLALKLYQRHGALALSDAVPALENFGFRVIDTVPTELGEDGALGTIHDFELALPAGLDPAAVLARAGDIERSIARVLNGAAENDAFNRLICTNGLDAREAGWLRAWYRYLRQAVLSFGIPTVVDAMQNAPMVTRGLIDLFVARHDPDCAGDRAAAEAAAEDAIRQGLAQVSAINDDRLLRACRAVVLAIVRTNAFVAGGTDGADRALAFKIDSALVPGLPRPVPWREVFVYSRRVEGIHLRSGPVARGGIRWSDRRDDFRTEILGLMKAQRVKNAVIVPTGAKGGFYPKQLPDPAADRDGWLAEGRESYRVFVRTLLSITDNIVDGAVVHPDRVVVRDGADPYFVVAADKGTATFSDTANAIAVERDFWLDDAFASGGSKGYDHKAMGITARGAWLSVRRHFLELGVDVQADPVRVAGVGDMSGDVFGNGMLLSRAIKLVAAFDHRHIFLDPDPDPVASWAERARLFALPRSSWDDYDRALISDGGGVFPRGMKEIPLSPQVRAMLGIDSETTDPDTLMTAILKAQVDLLWFGGIGTYIKGSAENNATVGDPANDSIRVDGRDVRARVIGEGANLGCTQAGRIDYALHGAGGAGGRNNTDFIDNSAGVDCSDKEVNIKIALASAKRDGRLDEDARVALLAAMTDDVAHLVLEDNRLQALGLSIAEAGGAGATGSLVRLIETLEEGGDLDRRTEGLADADTFVRRAAEGRGLTRPELAVLLSSAKLALQDALESTALVDDAGMEAELLAAFPPAMQGDFAQDILGHRLRREIIATRLANRLVNRLSLIHPFELAEEEGVGLAEIAGAFVAAERLFRLDETWRAIEQGDMPEAARIRLFERAAQAIRTHMADLLRAGGTLAPSRLVADLGTGIAALAQAAPGLLAAEARAQSVRMREELAAVGAPDGDAAAVAQLFDLDGAVGLACLARDSGMDATLLTAAFTGLGAQLGLDWAQGTAARMNPSDPWERLLVSGLARDFQHMRLDFLRRVGAAATDPGEAVEAWAQAQAQPIRQFRGMIARAQAAVSVSPAMLAQIAGQARHLLSR